MILTVVFSATSVILHYWKSNDAYSNSQQTARTVVDHLTRNLQTADASSYAISYFPSLAPTSQSLTYNVTNGMTTTTYCYRYYFPTDSTCPGQLWWGTISAMNQLTAESSGQNTVQLTIGVADVDMRTVDNPTGTHDYRNGIFCVPAITNTSEHLVYVDFVVTTSSGAVRPQHIEVFTSINSSRN